MGTRERALAGLTLCLVAWLGGCAPVAPWDRGRLAKPQMALETDPPQRKLREHTYRSREAATGQSIGKGGGCGCY
jgi:hypothetical protein